MQAARWGPEVFVAIVTVDMELQARTFMELKNHLLSLDLPEGTRKAWNDAL